MDTGIGIAPEFFGHVFDRIRQAASSHTRATKGLGLGLAIVKSLVELHGGTERVTSSGEGQGSTFTVQLPLSAAQRGASEDRGHSAGHQAGDFAELARSDLSGITILVVDDQLDALDLVQWVFEERSARVCTAISADEALRLVEAERPDVLVSDIGLRDVDGYALLRRVRALGTTRGGGVPGIA
jgi:PleD family two-component response regulator